MKMNHCAQIVPENIGMIRINRKDQNYRNSLNGLILKRVGETRLKIKHLCVINK
jgi:hypothetical protein